MRNDKARAVMRFWLRAYMCDRDKEDNLVNIWNAFCLDTGDDETITLNDYDGIDDLCYPLIDSGSMDARDIISAMCDLDYYNNHDRFVKIGETYHGYYNLISYNDLDDTESPLDIEYMAAWIADETPENRADMECVKVIKDCDPELYALIMEQGK